MTEDAAIRIDLHSAEVAHFTHTMKLLVAYLGTLPFPGGPVLLRQSSSPGVLPWVAPVSPRDTCHHRGQLNCPKRGRRQITQLAHRIIVAYLIRVARTHNPPSLEVPTIGRTIDQVRAVPYQQMWLHWWVRFGGTMTRSSRRRRLSLLSHILNHWNNNGNTQKT